MKDKLKEYKINVKSDQNSALSTFFPLNEEEKKKKAFIFYCILLFFYCLSWMLWKRSSFIMSDMALAKNLCAEVEFWEA